MENQFPNLQLNLNLTMEQEFRFKLFSESIQAMDSAEARSLLIEASKLLMVKDNIIKELMKQNFA